MSSNVKINRSHSEQDLDCTVDEKVMLYFVLQPLQDWSNELAHYQAKATPCNHPYIYR